MRSMVIVAVMMAMASPGYGADAVETEGEHRVPERVFDGEPRGPYQTGTFEELWVDAQREETTTSVPGDKRHLMVQVWYPASFRGDPVRARYVLHPGLYERETWWSLPLVERMATTSVLRAPVAPGPAWPVVVYNPGGAHPQFVGTFAAEFLASHGYVVVGIGHTGLNRIARFPDGTRYEQDRESPWLTDEEAGKFDDDQAYSEQINRFSRLMMPVHMQDIRFVLDRLSVLNETKGDRFYRRLDLEHVGAFGWSLGGALSLQASRDDDRIKAAINMDGTIFSDVGETGTHRPVMVMLAEDTEAPNLVDASEYIGHLRDRLRFWRFFGRCDHDWYLLSIARTDHGDFSDTPLMQDHGPEALRHLHPRLAHEIINAYTLEFFDRYLRGNPDAPLLSGARSYVEAKIQSRRPPEAQPAVAK